MRVVWMYLSVPAVNIDTYLAGVVFLSTVTQVFSVPNLKLLAFSNRHRRDKPIKYQFWRVNVNSFQMICIILVAVIVIS